MEWLNKVWSVMLMYKITGIVREGNIKARTDFQATWKTFWTLGPMEILRKRIHIH